MKSFVGAVLDQGGWKAYEGWLLGRLWELTDRVRENPGPWGDELPAGLAALENLDPTDLLHYGTPFFWLNVHRLYETRSPHAPAQVIRDLLMTAFDSYFDLLPDGARFAFSTENPQTLILPRLGIAIPGVSQVRLRRLASASLEIATDGAGQTLDLRQQAHPWRSRTLALCGDAAETVMATADPAVMASDGKGIFAEGDLRPFTARLAEGLTWIDKTDPELRASIRQLIHWFVPLNVPSPSLHLSYSEQDLIGVIHLSEGYSGIRLCEAVIHEFHHNQLYALQATQEFTCHDRGTIFYSPWRPDPRRLSSLLHALHVFTAVVKFYEAADFVEEIDFDRAKTRERRSELCQKLHLCLLQVPRQDLTPLGARVLQAIEQDILHQEAHLGLSAGSFSEAIRAHVSTWCETNPDYVQHLRWPGAE